MFAHVYVRVRELQPGDLVGGSSVASVSFYDGDYQIKFVDGQVKSGESFGICCFGIDRSVPDGWLNWSDSLFKDAPVITPDYVANDTWRAFPSFVSYKLVFVKGYYGDLVLGNWAGVGPSSAPYTMKAAIRADGVLCRPDCNNKIGTWSPAVVHASDWSVPFMVNQ